MIKKIKFTYFPIIFCFAISSKAQLVSSIVPVFSNPKAGKEIKYVYTPRKGLRLPGEIEVMVVYESRNQYNKKSIPAIKVNNKYAFSFKAPTGTAILIFGIIDAKSKVLRTNSLTVSKKTLIDNNSDTGFIMPLLNSANKHYRYENISLANLIYNIAEYELQLKSSAENLVAKYETGYKLYPEFIYSESYPTYLSLLYKLKRDSAQPILVNYAKETALISNEKSLLKARRIFRLLKMEEQQKTIEDKILLDYPEGKLAQDNFWNVFYDKGNEYKTESSLLSEMRKYIAKYSDSSAELKDKFYKEIIWRLIAQKEWNKLMRYENLISNKMIIPFVYNSLAWSIANRKIDTSREDLNVARIFSKRALDRLTFLIKNSNKDNFDEDPKAVNDMFFNTYALILYKLGNYDSAFFYQNEIYKKGKDFLDAEGLERYATYAERAKGIDFTRHFLEDELLNGTNSTKMIIQLQSIYKQLSLPEDELTSFQRSNNILTDKRNEEIIKKILGTVKAKEFKLKSIDGLEISLSFFKNKTVVLDFWATWCGPCKASFPQMQKLINKYKNDTSIVFLFIDVWERVGVEKNKKSITEFISANKYDFTVLFDENNKTVGDYKIEGIPTKIIIDKAGNVVFYGNQIDDDIEKVLEQQVSKYN